jgi:hypothetical protein
MKKTPNIDYLGGGVVKAEAQYDDVNYVRLSTLPKQISRNIRLVDDQDSDIFRMRRQDKMNEKDFCLRL